MRIPTSFARNVRFLSFRYAREIKEATSQHATSTRSLRLAAAAAAVPIADSQTPTSGILPTLANGLQTAVDATKTVLELIHSHADVFTNDPLPWWVVIIGSTLLLRVAITTPLTVVQQRVAARRERLQPVVAALTGSLRSKVMKQIQAEGASLENFDTRLRSAHKAAVNDLFRRHRCLLRHGLILPLAQIPLFIIMSSTWRSMSGYPVALIGSQADVTSGMSDGGTLWFTDLTLADSTPIFPLAIAATHLANIQLNAFLQKTEQTFSQEMIRGAMRASAFASVAIVPMLPMATSLYWLTSSTYSFVQNGCLHLPAVREWLGFPKKQFTKIEAPK